ncbi:MAG: ABC transporter permease [Saccharofermentans sp.]|nr:ABC transporter permease [Saccharofermentans sp.]
MSNSLQTILRGYAMKMIGTMDIMVTGANTDAMDGVDELTPVTKVGICQVGQYEFERDASSYTYTFEEKINVFSFSDLNAAFEMSLLPETIELDDTTAVINTDYADKFGVQEGDVIELETSDEEIIELTVAKIINAENNVLDGNIVIVDSEITNRISCTRSNNYSMWMIDVKDDSMISGVVDLLKTNDPKASVTSIDEMLSSDGLDQIVKLFYLMFLVSFLLVIFVTISIAEKIVNERMSVIGTLRSLGITPSKTAFVLLTENVIYAVAGASLGCLLYNQAKGPLLGSMLTVESAQGTLNAAELVGKTPVYTYLAVLLGAIIIECAYPLYELLKAVRISIRDIIFNNKDTEFKYKWSRLYIGIALVIISLVTGLLNKNFITLAIALICGVTALAVLIPYLILGISKGLSAAFRKAKMPVALLASENIARNKVIMGTAVICISSVLLSLLIGAVGNALKSDLSTADYNCNLSVDVYTSDKNHDYLFINNIEGVTETDYIYTSTVTGGQINDAPLTIMYIISDTPHTILNALPENGYGLASDEIVISRSKASNLGLEIGDELTVSFGTDTKFPFTRTFILADTVDTDHTDLLSTSSMIISPEVFEQLFHGSLGQILVNADDPDAVKERIENNTETGSVDVKTIDDIRNEYSQSSKGLMLVINLVITGSVALTLIGIGGNQALGFITRKRETAMLYSVALSRNKLKLLLFLESLFSIGISAGVAALAMPLLYNVLGKLLNVISEGDLNILEEGPLDIKIILVYFLIIMFVFMSTTLIPFRSLRKMKIAEELKYE